MPTQASSQHFSARLTARARAVLRLGGLGLFIAMPVAARTTLDVFTTHATLVEIDTLQDAARVDVSVYTVDDIEHLNEALSINLATEPTVAQANVQDRLAHLDSAQIKSLQQASRGLALAFELGVEKLPAWVFDRQAVVYGARDAARAWQAYQQWQRAAP